MRVLVFGASITQGFWDSRGGWVERLIEHYNNLALQDLRSNNQPEVFNLGISGDTTTGLAKRFKNEVDVRLWPKEHYIFIFSIGTNNAAIEQGQPRSTSEKYQADLESSCCAGKKIFCKNYVCRYLALQRATYYTGVLEMWASLYE